MKYYLLVLAFQILFNIFKVLEIKYTYENKLRLLFRIYGLDGRKSKDKFIPKEIFGLKKEKISFDYSEFKKLSSK